MGLGDPLGFGAADRVIIPIIFKDALAGLGLMIESPFQLVRDILAVNGAGDDDLFAVGEGHGGALHQGDEVFIRSPYIWRKANYTFFG